MLKVYVDPGHGGQDPGALGYGKFGETVKEKDIVLPISQLVRRCLLDKGCDVMISRNTDKFASLKQRVDEANAMSANAFLCIHSNARPSGQTKGFEIETYWLKPEEASYTRKVHFHLINGLSSEYSFIDPGIQVIDRGVKTANFMVLRETNMISTLVEIGFVTDLDDVVWLQDLGHQRLIGRLLCEAVWGYFQPS